MNCPNCGRETHGGYCDCMIVNGEFKGAWWRKENKQNLKERKVTDLLKEIEELKAVNDVIKEYNMMYLKEIALLRKQAERVHEQADLLREYREEISQLKRRCVSNCFQD